MQTQITGKGIELTEAIKTYADKKMAALNKFYNNKIIRAEIVVGVDSSHHLKGKKFFAECRLSVPGKDLFASKHEDVFYKAIDKIRDYLELELNKHKLKQRVTEKDKKISRANKEYKIED